jgi:hypothetical protein
MQAGIFSDCNVGIGGALFPVLMGGIAGGFNDNIKSAVGAVGLLFRSIIFCPRGINAKPAHEQVLSDR